MTERWTPDYSNNEPDPERSLEPVPINIIEAIDEHASLIEEIRCAEAVVKLANKALASYGLELVTHIDLHGQEGTSGEV